MVPMYHPTIEADQTAASAASIEAGPPSPPSPPPPPPWSRPAPPPIPQVRIYNRPRFTPMEALLINKLANETPDWVDFPGLQKYLAPVSPYGRSSRNSIIVAVAVIRAKIGEPKNHPRQLRSVYYLGLNAAGNRSRILVGYKWCEPDESMADLIVDESEITVVGSH
jgi:hypothetical protein